MAPLGFIGGTGDLGTALAVHLARDRIVLLGSRDQARSKSSIERTIAVKEEGGSHEYLRNNLVPATNVRVVKECDIILLTVPWHAAIETAEQLSQFFRGNQVLITTVAPFERLGNGFVAKFDPNGRSVAQQITEILGSKASVATAFQTIPAHVLFEEKSISADVLVSCDELTTFQLVAALISKLPGLRPLYLGTLEYSCEIERLTAMLLNLSMRNGLKSPTIRFSSF